MASLWKLVISLALPFLAAAVGSLFTAGAIPTWYATLQKPALSPPNWLFGPAWTLLYLLMGISFYLLWAKEVKKAKQVAIGIFVIQLVLNALWSIIFFGFKNPFLALFDIIFLWIAILLTIIYFYKISKPAAYLLIPYIAWVSFASYLNFAVWQLN